MSKLTLRLRLFITMLLIFLLPFGLLGGFGIQSARRAVMENASVSYQTMLENVTARLEQDIARMEELAITLSKDALINRIAWMQGDQIDYSRLDRYNVDTIKNQLALYCNQSGLYSAMALCFPQKDFALSTLGSWKLEWLWTDEFAISGMKHEDWLAILGGREERFFVTDVWMSTFGYSRPGMMCVQIPIKTALQKQPLLAVLFWVDASALRTYLQELAMIPGVEAIILDDAGRTVASLGEAPYERVAAFLGEGVQRLHTQGEAYRVMHTTSGALGWTIAALLPERTLFAQARQLTAIWLVILSALLCVGGALSYELALLNYRPLERIFRLFSAEDAVPIHPTQQEMGRVEALLGELMADQSRLRERVKSSRALLQYAALAHLLQGEPAPDDDLLRTLELPMPHAQYSVGVLRWGGAALAERAAQLFRASGIHAYWIRQEGFTIFILNFQEAQSLRGASARLEDLPTAMGLSDVCTAREALPDARAQAAQALDYRPVQPNTRAIFFTDVRDAGYAIFYPLEKEQILLNALRVGDVDLAMEQFEALLYHNAQGNPSRQTLRMFILAVELTALKADNADINISKSMKALPTFEEEDLDSVTRHVRALFELTASRRALQSQMQRESFCEALRAYLDENICDPQLSLKGVAEHFHMSTAALSQYIKEHMNMGYLEYVNRKRIILAKQMLSEGYCSVKVAAENVGFNNDVTFRRLFKKYEGITPSQTTAI